MAPAINKDYVLGFILIALGVGAAYIASGYPQGTLRFMGPGFVPNWLGRFIALLGVAILIRGLFHSERQTWDNVPWRALVLVPLATILFGIMVPRLGLLISCGVSALAVCAAVRGQRLPQALVVSLSMAGGFTLLFAILLKVPLPILPS